MAIQEIIDLVRLELKDAGAAWTDQDYILSVLSVVNRDIEEALQNLGLNFDTQVVILPGVPANTTDLSQYQADGQALSGLVLPKVVEWRLVGENNENWKFVPPVDKEIDTDTGTGAPGAVVASNSASVESWEWRGGIVFISPASMAVDIRVRFQSLPTILNADQPNQPFRGLINPLGYATCEHIENQRLGGNSANAAKFEKWKTRAFGTFRATQVQATHSKVERLAGRRSGNAQGMN